MTFLNHSAIVWVLAGVPVVLLYLWRAPLRRQSVGTGFLWEEVFSKAGGRLAWWRVRRPVSLCVQLAVLGLLVAALAEPHFRRPRRLVIVIDNSASMNATDAEPTRLGEAGRRARRLIEALGPADQTAIITGGDPLRVACRLTAEVDVLQQSLEAVSAGDGATRVVDAVALGRRILDGGPEGQIVVFTDGCFEGAATLAQADDVRLIAVGGRGDNLAITRLAVRRCPTDPVKCQVFLEVSSFSDERAECGAELELDGEPIERVPMVLDAGERWRRVFEIDAAEGGRLTARLDRVDVLEADNRASVDVPEPLPNDGARRGAADLAEPRVGRLLAAGDLRSGEWPGRETGHSALGETSHSVVALGESDVRVPEGLGSPSEAGVAEAGGPRFSLWLVAAVGAVLLLAAEWHLFQRRWTC